MPLGALRRGGRPAARVEPLPGRHGPAGRDPLPCSAGSTRPTTRWAGSARPTGSTIGELTPETLAAPLYLPPVAPSSPLGGPWAMPCISDRLRQPDGCPWDREQTHASLRKHLLEETYEVYDALEQGATPALAEELGDLLLQVVLHAQLAAEAGVFDLADVQASIAAQDRPPPSRTCSATRSRGPAADVNRQWERIKADERAAAAEAR